MARWVCAGLKVSCFFFFSSRRRHTRFDCDWSSDVCSSDLRSSIRLCIGRQSSERQRRSVTGSSATGDRKSTRLNSSHSQISYAVFCLKKKKNKYICYHLYGPVYAV